MAAMRGRLFATMVLFLLAFRWLTEDYDVFTAIKSITNNDSFETATNHLIMVNQSVKTSSAEVGAGINANEPNVVTDEPNMFDGVRARTYPRWPGDHDLPCYRPRSPGQLDRSVKYWTEENTNEPFAKRGLFFNKLWKVAGTTAAGIHLRISRNLATRLEKEFPVCRNRFMQGTAKQYGYVHRNHRNSFLWTMVRDPSSRLISQFFHFAVSRKGVAPTTANMITYLNTSKLLYFGWLASKGYRHRPENDTYIANEILHHDYDFVGITERFDESMVAVKMLLGLKLADILYVSSKTSGGYDDGEFEKRCVKIQPSIVPARVKEFLHSPAWKDRAASHVAFYRAANRSLDLTIDSVLGRDRFGRELSRYRDAQRRVQETCAEAVKLPCSSTGQRREPADTDCWYSDIGCGFDCLDRVATDLDLW